MVGRRIDSTAMTQLTLHLPDDVASAIGRTTEEFAAQLRLMAALKLFELGKLSSGKAAELAGLTRVDFLEACGRYRVSAFNYGADETERELRRDLDTLHASRP
jgi:predicted HTH domain antitoxin